MPNNQTYKGYPLFNSLENVNLQAWNRLAVYFNIISAAGTEEAKKYVGKFNDFEKIRIKNLMKDIQERGYNTVRREVLMENNKATSIH